MRPLLLTFLALTAIAREPTLDLYWIDSEGGGSTLIVTPAGESILIDTGNPGGRDPQRIHRVATQVAGLTKLDHVIITHFHGDHFGGLAELAQLLPIGTLHDKGITEKSPDSGANELRWTLQSRPYREAKVGQRHVIGAGDVIPLAQREGAAKLTLQCLGANQKFIPATDAHADNKLTGNDKPIDLTDNANSVVMLLGFGEFTFFDGGDLTWNVEAQLVAPKNRVGHVDLYQVNHHGLDSSNNPLFIQSLTPTVAMMNNGPRKGTTPSTMAALRSTPSIQAIYQLHENQRDDHENTPDKAMIANHGDLGEQCAAHHVHCLVTADGKAFTMEVPSQKHSRTFDAAAR